MSGKLKEAQAAAAVAQCAADKATAAADIKAQAVVASAAAQA